MHFNSKLLYKPLVECNEVPETAFLPQAKKMVDFSEDFFWKLSCTKLKAVPLLMKNKDLRTAVSLFIYRMLLL